MKYATTILMLLPAILLAQDIQFQLETDSIPVVMEGWNPYEPWAGGESESSPGLCDIDADGDLDFFLGNFWGKISYFENHGIASIPNFSLISLNYAGVDIGGIPYSGRTDPCFADIDADGDLDLFTGDGMGLIHFWENVGTPQVAAWAFITDTLAGIDADGFSKLKFKDLDADNDFDMVLGDYFGKVWLYQNSGSPSAFNFSGSPIWIGSITVGQNASPALVDIDADGDYDLFIGERYGEIWYYRNDGDSANYNFTYVTNNYFGIDAGDYSSPEFADIDGDGDYDLFVGREANPASLIGDVFFYENLGTPQNAQFRLVTKNYLMLDIWYIAPRVQLVDINGDGAKDLMLGASSYLHYFMNTGDSAQAQFEFIEQGFQGIYQPSMQPYFVDIDADGDYDLFCGHNVLPNIPSVALYLNHGSAQNPQLVLYSNNFITNPNFSVNVGPVLVDIDDDGDYDLFLYDGDDHFYYYQNNGTPQWPDFALITNQWQGINSRWYFSFADLDHDLDLDLVSASQLDQDNLFCYINVGGPQSPQMVLATTTLLDSSYQYIYTPYLVDIDSDEDYDLFVGHTNGGILFFRNVTGDSSGVAPRHPSTAPYRGPVLSIGPNPANPLTVISCQLPVPSNLSLEIFDISGKKVMELASGLHLPGEYRYVWDASKNASGIYIIRLKTPEFDTSQKLTIVK